MPIAICQNCRRQWCWRIYIHISMYLFCIWMYLGFKHNMCLRGGIVSLFDFCFLLDASFSEQVFFHCKSRQQFWERKTKSRTSHRKIRKIESWKVKRLHCQFRKVEKSKSRKVEKWNGVIFNFEKSKSWKVKRLRFEFRKIEKSKRILFDFWLFDFLKFVGCLSSWTCAALFSSLGNSCNVSILVHPSIIPIKQWNSSFPGVSLSGNKTCGSGAPVVKAPAPSPPCKHGELRVGCQ